MNRVSEKDPVHTYLTIDYRREDRKGCLVKRRLLVQKTPSIARRRTMLTSIGYDFYADVACSFKPWSQKLPLRMTTNSQPSLTTPVPFSALLLLRFYGDDVHGQVRRCEELKMLRRGRELRSEGRVYARPSKPFVGKLQYVHSSA